MSDINDKVVEKLVKARIAMLLQCPFFGNLATRLKLVDATDKMPTAATDGRHLFYNRDFINKLDKQETIFLLAHEVLHNVYDHMDRRGSRDPQMWNAAADYVINGELHDHKIGKLPDPKTSGVQACFDPKYKGMFSEEVYAELNKNAKTFRYEQFDVHMGQGEGDEEMTEEERKALGDEIRQAVMQAAKTVDAGHVPAGVKRMITDLTEPQMDWREILQMQIQSAFKADYSWTRQSRKSMGSGFYLPGMIPDVRLDVDIAIDTSGSMSEKMLKDLLGEVKGIMGQFPDFQLGLWCFDTDVHNYQKFTPDNIEDIHDYKIMGGGGTIFQVNWDFMKKEDIHPHRFLIFSDGYDSSPNWGEADYCETIFLIHGDPQHRLIAPHGMQAWYDSPDA